jgi:hypothetical protein
MTQDQRDRLEGRLTLSPYLIERNAWPSPTGLRDRRRGIEPTADASVTRLGSRPSRDFGLSLFRLRGGATVIGRRR